MSNNKTLKLLAATGLAVSTSVAIAQVETFTASMDLLSPITITNTTPLDMAQIEATNTLVCQVNGDGTLESGQDGGCLGGTPVGGVVDIDGTPSTAYTITLGNVANAPTDITFEPFLGNTYGSTTLAAQTFDGSGDASHTVGARVTVGASPAVGANETVNYDVTVTYD